MEPTSDRQTRRVAVFDFDGTSIRGQSGSLFTRYLMRRGIMSPGRLCRLAWWGVRYKLHLPYRQAEARELVFGSLAGKMPDEVEAIMRDFHDGVLAPLYRPEALAEVARCHEEGLVVLIVSATFEGIARCAAEAMGADGYAATRMALDEQGRCTCRVEGPVVAGAEKYRAAEAWCDAHLGRGGWVIERAYGDHHTDVDLLARARHPYAVCPGKTLVIAARRNGWPILDWDL
ncbi:HAD family hydrolase [Thermophilibacter mediterraneus]|uniref:HAD family hydrolase n=1 Tax=Thermophilibacter mediterraneus TaxID=1871031 RepID=UPI00235685D3|nr:HAD family hydrolase [Thermophilibacter mediterraneus]